MSSGAGLALLVIAQAALLVLNHLYKWNLPWYLLWSPLLIVVLIFLAMALIFVVGLIIAVLLD